MTGPCHPATVVSVTTEGLPDAFADGDHVVLAWAAEAYVAVLAAYRNATGDDVPVAAVAHSGRVMITARLTNDPPDDPPEGPS